MLRVPGGAAGVRGGVRGLLPAAGTHRHPAVPVVPDRRHVRPGPRGGHPVPRRHALHGERVFVYTLLSAFLPSPLAAAVCKYYTVDLGITGGSLFPQYMYIPSRNPGCLILKFDDESRLQLLVCRTFPA